MTREMALANGLEMSAETLLWRGVIARTIQDWLSTPLRPKREAEQYLFENSADLSSVCASAGIDVGRLRIRLNMVRGRTLPDLLPTVA
jgi:hypothetical protein